ncbi:M12 family metallo-peptidase [Flaviramulus sp. BrNp1-15]|uniref:zinc-dependent metalloprotease n=1 Tax=Flaviramulus sp. BrNp1-15 TaxID=2916754 RepID=UPI001EE842A5|nr:zinc-dependent metalloprotease family protein [Flaviramulus sp. BrNp1-15]ULC59560.1 M12 family metallo-peptidase [Flaviramulus sp. BrNp1-15]
MKTKLHYVLSIAMLLSVFSVKAQISSFKEVKTIKNSKDLSKFNLDKSKVHFFELDRNLFKKNTLTATLRGSQKKKKNTVITIPGINGTMESFNIYEAPVFSHTLALKYPNIKSYVGYSTNKNGAKLRMSISPQGVHTMITFLDKSTVFMQPTKKGSNQYVVYDRGMKVNSLSTFKCGTIESINQLFNKTNTSSKIDEGGANNKTLQKFRIAISTTSEYTAYHDDGISGNGDAISDALSAINVTLSRVNEVFETDMAVTFELVDATQLIYNNAATDPYSDASIGANQDNSDELFGWSLQLQNTLSSSSALGNNLTERNNAYDIGHLFGDSGGGGNAGCIGCVCSNDTASNADKNKGSAFTSPADGIPEGDTFDINYVVHEIGHQMGANHTWAFTTEGTGVNSEPGSGSTIMAYAGITGPDDVQTNSDDYFHYHSIKQILDNLSTKSCQTIEPISNNPPIADAGNNYIIPAGTPYILKGTATGIESGESFTYCWEQIDSGKTDYLNFGPDLVLGSMNRSLPPSSSPDRYIPRLSSVLNGNITQTNPGLGSDWETVANVDRILNWALTVRDREPIATGLGGQSSYDTMQIQVTDGSVSTPIGPFIVTSQNSYISYPIGSSQMVTWDVANTNLSPINTALVNIRLSTDGGLTFPTILVSNTSNDGTENINLPMGVSAPFCRIMVEPVGNIYYGVNSTDFSIGYTVSTTCNQQFSSNSNLNISIPDEGTTNDIINVPVNGVISDVKINVDVTHSFISDLTLTLTHPNGTTSTVVWEENCFINTGYEDFDIIFEDGASAVVCASPTTGTYIPANSLSIFDELESSGDWTLTISDGFQFDTGNLNDWYLEFCLKTVTLSSSNDIEFSEFKVYPNPNNGEFTLKLNINSSNTINVEVYDLRGRIIHKKTFENTGDFNKKITLNDIQSGMYILSVSDGIRKSTKKIVIE